MSSISMLRDASERITGYRRGAEAAITQILEKLTTDTGCEVLSVEFYQNKIDGFPAVVPEDYHYDIEIEIRPLK